MRPKKSEQITGIIGRGGLVRRLREREGLSMDRGAATEDEIAYVDALDATYYSLIAMVKK